MTMTICVAMLLPSSSPSVQLRLCIPESIIIDIVIICLIIAIITSVSDIPLSSIPSVFVSGSRAADEHGIGLVLALIYGLYQDCEGAQTR
jgi:hypothetical protein